MMDDTSLKLAMNFGVICSVFENKCKMTVMTLFETLILGISTLRSFICNERRPMMNQRGSKKGRNNTNVEKYKKL